jgi:competence protein ComEC
LLVGAACSRFPVEPDEEFIFAVLDVGQGLSQVGVQGSRSIVWDMGPGDEHRGWIEGYRRLGKPTIGAMVLSHSDEDHIGGLEALDTATAFSGTVIVSPFADTALIRRRAGPWAERIFFRVKSRGDTLGGLEPATIEILWPAPDAVVEHPFGSRHKNRYSLCCRVRSGESTAFISSDIDSVAMRILAWDRQWQLASQVLVVPHHGSGGGLEPTFYGYVYPRYAVVSCGHANAYGHPADEILDVLFFLRSEVLITAEHGHVVGSTDGTRWQWRTGLPE